MASLGDGRLRTSSFMSKHGLVVASQADPTWSKGLDHVEVFPTERSTMPHYIHVVNIRTSVDGSRTRQVW